MTQPEGEIIVPDNNAEPVVFDEPTIEEQLAQCRADKEEISARSLEMENRIAELNGEALYERLASAEKGRDEAIRENARLNDLLQEMAQKVEAAEERARQDNEMVSRLVVERNSRNRRIEALQTVQEEVSATLAPLTVAEEISPMTETEIVAVAKEAKDKLDGKGKPDPNA